MNITNLIKSHSWSRSQGYWHKTRNIRLSYSSTPIFIFVAHAWSKILSLCCL